MKLLNVLIVEDNEPDVLLTEEVLSLAGIEADISVARDGVEAIDFIVKNKSYDQAITPDLVMLDINLPKLNGKEVLSFIKSNPKYAGIHIIMYTSSKLETDILFCYKAGVDLYLNKPYAMNDFEKVIEALKKFKAQKLDSN